MLFQVPVKAPAISVTAESLHAARRYAESDAREFLQNWNYELGVITPARPEAQASDLEWGAPLRLLEVDTDHPEGEDAEYVFDACWDVVVDATDVNCAGAAALAFMRAP